jgi:hypothetical protein
MKNPPEAVKPMLNTASEAETVGEKWLQKVLSRLAASRIATKKIGEGPYAKKIERRWGF